MKVLKFLAIGLAAILALFVLIGLVLDRQWNVERSIVVNASAERIHPFVDNLQKWQEWAAWNKAMDPDVKWTYSGPEAGVGATWAWDGPVMGHGRMTITASDPQKGVKVDEAIESEEVNAHGALTFTAEGEGTKVVWTDSGTLPPVIGGYAKGMIEKMLGDNFEQGLAHLKTAVEALPPPEPAAEAAVPEAAPAEGEAADGGAAAEGVAPAPADAPAPAEGAAPAPGAP